VTPAVAGVDIGGTKTLAVALGDDDTILATVRRPTPSGSVDDLLAATTDVLHELLAAVDPPGDVFAAIGVGIPGLIDRSTGRVRHAVNLALGDEPVELRAHLRRTFGSVVAVDNDVNVAAVGAAAALGRTGDLAYLSVGTGVAAGFLLDGRIRHGAHGAAGEIGHLPVDPLGPLCECGQRGCLEAVASGSAIARRWSGGDGEGASSAVADLFAAAARGDTDAIGLRDQVAGHLAWAVAVIAQTVDPDTIVLGGGVLDAGDALIESVVGALRARAAASPVLNALDLAGRTASVPAGVPAGALGAALLARSVLAGRAPPPATASVDG
jgi:glucokinase